MSPDGSKKSQTDGLVCLVFMTLVCVLCVHHSIGLGSACCHGTLQPPCGADSCRRHSAPQWLKLELPAPAAAPSESAAGYHRIAGSHRHTDTQIKMKLDDSE